MKRLAVVTLAISVLAPGASLSEPLSGNQLYAVCTSSDQATSAFCIGYVIGETEGQFLGGLMLYLNSHPESRDSDYNDHASRVFGYCVPKNASNAQLRDVVVKFLRENPERRHETARFLVMESYVAAFPCN